MDQFIKDLAQQYAPVGSRVTCDPPPMDTDEDFLIWINESDKQSLFAWLNDQGYALAGYIETFLSYDIKDIQNLEKLLEKTPEHERFYSFKKDIENLIVTCSPIFYHKFLIATRTAKELNLMNKLDRINLFQAILYNK